jgi:periplasmic mercuric ion binding protein
MKTIQLITLFLIFNSQFVSAQKNNNIDTLSFKVEGVCNMCKARIEKAALIKGVVSAEWDKNTKMLTILHKSSKSNIEDIHESISKAGHTTDQKKGDSVSYKNLPSCCSYDDGVKTH